MTLLTGMFFAGLALLALVAYLTLDHLQQAEMEAYRQLVQVYHEASREHLVARATLHPLETSGFFLVGSVETVEHDIADVDCRSLDADPCTIRPCA
ncbi:MAG: hypothetical protein EOM08_00095 [Clostridia bacterium]|nr:hypothetical protein [Clostridia bacterium]